MFKVQKIACQLVSALYYLHSHRVLHRGEYEDIRNRIELFRLNRYETTKYINLSWRKSETMRFWVSENCFIYERLECDGFI